MPYPEKIISVTMVPIITLIISLTHISQLSGYYRDRANNYYYYKAV